MLIREVILVILLVLLALGAYSRYRVMQPQMARLNAGDQVREWLGYGLFLLAASAVVSVFWLYSQPITGFVALSVLVSYNLTAAKQFPIFR